MKIEDAYRKGVIDGLEKVSINHSDGPQIGGASLTWVVENLQEWMGDSWEAGLTGQMSTSEFLVRISECKTLENLLKVFLKYVNDDEVDKANLELVMRLIKSSVDKSIKVFEKF